MKALLGILESQINPTEAIAVLAIALNVYLTARNNIWCWAWGIVGVVLYGYVFYTTHLYSSMILQVVYYLPMQFYGWYVWLRHGPTRDNDLRIASLTIPRRFFWLGINFPLAVALGYLMHYTSAQLTYPDALVTVMSVTAQYLLTYKYIENWLLWIPVDLLYTFYLLPKQGLYVSACLFFLLLLLSLWGFLQWLAVMRREARSKLRETNKADLQA